MGIKVLADNCIVLPEFVFLLHNAYGLRIRNHVPFDKVTNSVPDFQRNACAIHSIYSQCVLQLDWLPKLTNELRE